METYFGEIEQAHGRLARERALEDLKTLARDAEDLLKATAHDASDKTKEARSRVAAALNKAKATIVDVQGQALATAKAAAKGADSVIREHTYKSVGVAFGVGLLIGVLAIRVGRD
jgi:ElaB/YqjD/DUF883 family membrane-anchored ribosome-binding protein